MPMPMHSTKILIEKIQSLPMNRIAEVEDFVEFLKQQALAFFKQHLPDVRLIYLFGSHASHQAQANSDVDLAILPAQKISPLERWQLQQMLSNKLSVDVDLVDLLFASTVMRKEVISKGLCLYDASNYAIQFEMQVMSMYQHLNEERAELLAAFKGENNG